MKPNWGQIFWRWLLFSLIVGGAIWFLSHYRQEGQIEGQEVVIPPLIKAPLVKILPPSWQEKMSEKGYQWWQHRQQQMENEQPWLKDVRQQLEKVSQTITGFPQQSKKEIKRQIVKQMCNELLKEVDSDQEQTKP